jgi:hypothetical protein
MQKFGFLQHYSKSLSRRNLLSAKSSFQHHLREISVLSSWFHDMYIKIFFSPSIRAAKGEEQEVGTVFKTRERSRGRGTDILYTAADSEDELDRRHWGGAVGGLLGEA